jgi:hypothetical protein
VQKTINVKKVYFCFSGAEINYAKGVIIEQQQCLPKIHPQGGLFVGRYLDHTKETFTDVSNHVRDKITVAVMFYMCPCESEEV